MKSHGTFSGYVGRKVLVRGSGNCLSVELGVEVPQGAGGEAVCGGGVRPHRLQSVEARAEGS